MNGFINEVVIFVLSSVENIGSTFVSSNWGSLNDATFTVDVSLGGVATVESEETSTDVKDLDPSTTYTLNIFATELVHEPLSVVRFELNTTSTYLVIVEVEIYDIAGNYISADNFNFSSSSALG